MTLRVLTQENRGPAAARNTGVAVASGEWVAFLGDDTVPSPGWLATHREAHRTRGDESHLAVIGYTGWHKRMRLTPFLRYINEYGLQFGYALIKDREDVPFNFLYTSNLSLRRDLLLAEPFDLHFPYAAWEDIELAYRLKKRGLRLVYEPSATGPTITHGFDRFASREEKAGYCAVVFYRLHPELGPFSGRADGRRPSSREPPEMAGMVVHALQMGTVVSRSCGKRAPVPLHEGLHAPGPSSARSCKRRIAMRSLRRAAAQFRDAGSIPSWLRCC